MTGDRKKWEENSQEPEGFVHRMLSTERHGLLREVYRSMGQVEVQDQISFLNVVCIAKSHVADP